MIPRHALRSLVLLVTLVGAVVALSAVPAVAVTYDITISNDNDSVNGDCSLREALHAATANVARDACPAGSPTATDSIVLHADVIFDGGLYYMNDLQGGPLVIQGPTSDPADTVISLAFSNRFLYLLNGDPVSLEHLSVFQGAASGPSYGGVIRAANTSLALDGVSFGLNSAIYGGAVSFLTTAGDRSLVIERSILSTNRASGSDSAAGGGLWVSVAGATVVKILDSTISGNTVFHGSTSSAKGGGAWVSASGASSVLIADSLFGDNSGEADNWNRGAGIFLELGGSAEAEIRDSTFSNNHWVYASPTDWAPYDGAYLRANDSAQLLIERCSFENNHSPNTGDPYQLGVVTAGTAKGYVSSVLLFGGYWAVDAIALDTSTLVLSHLTVTGNERSVRLSRVTAGELVEINNSILSLNTSPSAPVLTGGAHAFDNYVNDNPSFVNAGAGDYRLQSSSNAIDDGNQNRPGVRFTDLDHAPRVTGDETDAGAYEWGGLFADDLETGDRSAWPATAP